MKDEQNLHWYIAQLRPFEADWKRDNPGRHPVEMAREMALEIVDMVKEQKQKEVFVHPASISGVTEYGYAISYLEESGILVKYLKRSE